MPPTLFYRTVLFTKRSITRCLEHAGDRQIFNFTVSGTPGSTYQGRRHAAEALNGEAAKRPSNAICARTRTCRLVGGTPRQPKSSNFHTRGLSTICHFLAPWKTIFLYVKCSEGRFSSFLRAQTTRGGVSALFRAEVARVSFQSCFYL